MASKICGFFECSGARDALQSLARQLLKVLQVALSRNFRRVWRLILDVRSLTVGEPSAPNGLDAVYREHFAGLMRVAFLMLGSNDAAEDLVHDVFLRCADRLADLENPSSYLRVSVVNACRREFRRRTRLTGVIAEIAVTAPTSETVDLRRALLALGPRKRAAVVLRFYEDMSFDEVASALGCAPSTARSLVRRAMNEMRGAIDER